VENYMNQSGGPPTIKQDICGNVENIEHILESFSIMMASCMQSEYCKHVIHLLDIKIKVFLSECARFDEGMKSRNDALNVDVPRNTPLDEDLSVDDEYAIIDTLDNDLKKGDIGDYYEEPDCVIQDGTKTKNTEKPKWLISYSFLCLTNLPDVISNYGPLRLYWEGGGLGEKLLQHLKILWIGFRKNWIDNTLKDVYQHVELIIIGVDLKAKWKTTEPKMFHIYSDCITVRNAFMQKNPCM
jgi:hypothetical protein